MGYLLGIYRVRKTNRDILEVPPKGSPTFSAERVEEWLRNHEVGKIDAVISLEFCELSLLRVSTQENTTNE